MTVYEVRNGGNAVTVKSVSMASAVTDAAEELNVYTGTFSVYNCMGDMHLGDYTWEEAQEEEAEQ